MNLDDKQTHVSQKVYYMPDSYNALREELDKHWPTLFAGVGWFMAFDGPKFVEIMNATLDTLTQFDTDNVDGICKRYLDELRVKRGLTRLHNASEYHVNTTMEQAVREAREQADVAPWKQEPKS